MKSLTCIFICILAVTSAAAGDLDSVNLIKNYSSFEKNTDNCRDVSRMYAGLQKPSSRENASNGQTNYATRRDRMPDYWLNKPWCHEGKYTDECAPVGWTVADCVKVFNDVDPDMCVYGHRGRRGGCDLTGQLCFDVDGVAADDVLNVRQKPTHKSEITGKLAYNAKDVQVRVDDLGPKLNLPKKGWIPVRWCSTGPTESSCDGRLIDGYVNARYLAKRVIRDVPVKWVRTPR